MRGLTALLVLVALTVLTPGCFILADQQDRDRDAENAERQVQVDVDAPRDLTPTEEGAFERLGSRMDKGAKKLDEKLEKGAGRLGEALEKTGRELQEKSAEAQRERQQPVTETVPDVDVDVHVDRP